MSVKVKRKTKAIVPRIKLCGIKSNKNAMNNIDHEATTNKQLLMPEKLKQILL